MREIKFRAWDKEYKHMINDFSPVCHGEMNIFDFSFLARWRKGIIPMQYTGLKDKNGKEIYEGDIVTGSSLKDWRAGDGERAIIEWDNTRSRWNMIFYSIYGGEGHLCKEEIFQDRTKVYEVIGNIYENPELLIKQK